jgi:uncharacterized protein (DUF1330 family)
MFGVNSIEVYERQRMYTTRTNRFTRGAASAFICVTLALGTAGVASAGTTHHGHSSTHENGHQFRVEGTVTALGTNTVTVQSHHGTPVVYTTTATTTYFLGKTASTVAALAVGENVDLTLTSTTPQTVTSVEIDLAKFEGKVTAISGNTITISGEHSGLRTVVVSATTTYTLDHAPSTLGAITVGSEIGALGIIGSTPNTLNAISVKIHQPKLHTRVEGTVTALGANTLTVQSHHGTPVVYTTTATTTYFLGKTASTVAALAVGENVDLTLTSTTPQTVTSVEIDLAKFEGKVTAISGNTITISGEHSGLRTVVVSATTTYTLDHAPSTLGAITVGSEIGALGLIGSTPNTLNAISVKIHLHH